MCPALFVSTRRLLGFASSATSASVVARCRRTSGPTAVQEGSFARDSIASRRGRRVTCRIRYPGRRTGQLRILAPNERNRGGRKAEVGIGSLEPLLSRPGPPFDRTGHAGRLVCVLKR